MKTLLTTGYDEKMSRLGRMTSELMKEYADNWKFHFEIFDFSSHKNCHPSWAKLIEVTSSLHKYDRVIWMDADVAISNPKIPVPETRKGFHVSRDWGLDASPYDFNAGVFISHTDVIPFFEDALKRTCWSNEPLWDQTALKAASINFRDKITIYPRRIFNSVPREIHETVVEPWERGDWLAHLTMIPLEKKISLFGDYHFINSEIKRGGY